MALHILGGCGSFMAGLATIAKEKNEQVVVYDIKYQSPMLDQLNQYDITMKTGYDHRLPNSEDTLIIGNAISRGVPMLEQTLVERRGFLSGPQWLHEAVLSTRKTIAISGTHGKTTTTSLFAWVMESLQQEPGFLIGGIANNFNTSARLGSGQWFVIEADEYDTCFSDKRPKFFHYPADLLVINNLEFDHADIYRDLEDIVKQFRYYLRTLVPGAVVVYPKDSEVIDRLVAEAFWVQACPTHGENSGEYWCVQKVSEDWSEFLIIDGEGYKHCVQWDLFGQHNAENALTVMRGAVAIGFDVMAVAAALSSFRGVKKRMQKIGVSRDNQEVWDDYAHHPTAIKKVIAACRKRFDSGRLVMCFQFSNYTQARGVMWRELVEASEGCDVVLLVDQGGVFPYQDFKAAHTKPVQIIGAETTISEVQGILQPGDRIVTCGSRDCTHIHDKILA